MLISREKFDELLKSYVFTDAMAEEACNFVYDLLRAEKAETQKQYPNAFATLNDLDNAEYTVSGIGSDVSDDNFGEE